LGTLDAMFHHVNRHHFGFFLLQGFFAGQLEWHANK